MTSTLTSPRSYAARVYASSRGGVRPETAAAFSPTATIAFATRCAWSTPAAYTMPGRLPNMSA